MSTSITASGVSSRHLGVWALLLPLASLTGCFPYRETYRPQIVGHVVDESGAPVAGAPVETCSASKWDGLRGDCPRRATTTSAADGSFTVPRKKEVEWCCVGEAALPFTIVSVCMPDRRVGGATFDSTKDPIEVRIPIGSTEALSVVGQNAPTAARSSNPVRDVKDRCSAASGPR